MYTKQEASQLRQQFWTAFGQYMLPILSADSEKVAWVNYKTGIKDIYFKMNADSQMASIAIEIRSKDAGLQALYFEQFQQLQTVLHDALSEDWTGQLHTTDEYGNTVSRIYKELSGVNILKKKTGQPLSLFSNPAS